MKIEQETETGPCDHPLKIVIVWWMFAKSRSALESLTGGSTLLRRCGI